jgi:hypothetical protein
LAERVGNLVPVRGEHGIETALLKVSDAILREIGTAMNWIPELIEAARNGEPVVRRTLRRLVLTQRTSIAGKLSEMSTEASLVEVNGYDIDLSFPQVEISED